MGDSVLEMLVQPDSVNYAVEAFKWAAVFFERVCGWLDVCVWFFWISIGISVLNVILTIIVKLKE